MDERDQSIPAFGPVLRRLRTEKGMTQEEYAARLGWDTAAYISQLELGQRKPSLEQMFKLAFALDMTASVFVVEMEKEQIEKPSKDDEIDRKEAP